MKTVRRYQALGQTYKSPENALQAERDFLIQRIKLIQAQDQGAGGNSTPNEFWPHVKEICNDTLLILENGETE